IGPSDTTYLSWDGRVQVTSHAYEAFIRNQFEGWYGIFDYSGQREELGSRFKLDRYDLNFKYLYNVKNFSPPLLIVASRLEGIFVDTHGRHEGVELAAVPTDYRIFYGGDQNIRGFSRQSLDNNGLGFVSALLAGFELRLIEVLPYRLE